MKDLNSNNNVNNLQDYESLKKLYDELQLQENEVEKELEGVIKEHDQLLIQLESVPKLVSSLDILSLDGNNLSNIISKTSLLAENVSSKVRLLDFAKGCIQDAIKRVDDILDLKSCVEGVKHSFKNEEYEQAAAFIHRYLSLDERALREILPADTEENDLSASFSYLHEAKASLQADVSKKFDEAVIARSRQQVERFFKLFPLVGLQEEGLLKFSKYLRAQIAEYSELNLDAALRADPKERLSSVIFAGTLTNLFESIAKVIDDQQPLVDTFYGPGMMLTVLKELQLECDLQAKYILEQFFISRSFQKVCENLTKTSDKQKGSDIKERVDPKDLDLLLGEIVLFSARAEIYHAFLNKRIQNDLDVIHNGKPGENEFYDVYLKSGLCRNIETLMSDYIVMESYFMKQMMLKAIAMDMSDRDSITSSAVDDIFFVLQKCLRRTISAKNMNIACAVINNASAILTSEYMDFFKSKIKTVGFLSSSLDISGMFQGKAQTNTTDLLTSKRDFLVVLNNIDTSCEYLAKLVADITEESVQKINQSEQLKLQSCLNDLATCSQEFKNILQTGILQLCTNALLPKIYSLIDSYVNVKHVLTEEDFSYYEVNDPFVQNLIAGLDSKIVSLKDCLTTTNYGLVVSMLCHEISARLEKVIIKCTFNRLGGLQLDKDLRSLIQYLTNASEWTIRDKFARITQISTILNLDKVNELLDYWGENSGPLTWRLTPGEVRAVLALRSDFRNEDIQRLKL
ncbi:conserved oligomeric Golgi complex subunit 4 isoform X2 [Hydra vulgaris]|uniref:Conserved oligomeric Golgi complex subunit 4 n=1 Tax=Hydra vulgaris TaxID=6087 RepID=A0ABM4DN08_HYDVU